MNLRIVPRMPLVLALAMLWLGFSLPSQAAIIQVDGNTATEILGIDVGGARYDLTFKRGTFFSLNTGSNFPFINDNTNMIALMTAAINALNARGPGVIDGVGPSAADVSGFFYHPGNLTLPTVQVLSLIHI